MTSYCVTYMRFSSDNQRETSIEHQRACIEQYCRTNNLTIVKEYIDRAQSGTTAQRDAFQELIADAQCNPSWNYIVVYDLSRFSRDMYDALTYVNLLSGLGINLVSTTEPFSSSAEDIYMRNMKFCTNQYFSDHNAVVCHDGQKTQAAKGKHCGGIPPLGYNLDETKHLVVNEDEAEIVRTIFRMYLDGYSYTEIAKTLNAAGHTTKIGNPFNKNSFSSLLCQHKYIGTFVWNRAPAKRRGPNGKRSTNTHRSKPLEEQVRLADGCPAIIPLDQFQQVQELLSSRARGRSSVKARHHYVLGGLGALKCGVCGRSMVGVPRTCRGVSYTTYRCPNHNSKDPAACPTKELSAAALDKLVIKHIVAYCFRKEHLPLINELLVSNAGSEALLHQRNGLARKISNLVKNMELHYSEALAARLETLEAQKAAIDTQLEQDQSDPKQVPTESFQKTRTKLYNYLMTSSDPAARDFLRNIIREIRITNDTVSFDLKID